MAEQEHRVNLMVCFLALLALTAAEVGLYEMWVRNAAFHEALPKFALVLLILAFTLPKAMIVLIFFMHLKFEKLTIVALAVLPFVVAGVCVLPILTDSLTLSERQPYSKVPDLGQASIHAHGGHGAEADLDSHGEGH